jgi:hypothetical protein
MKINLLQALFVLLSSCTSNGQEKITGKYLTDSKESYVTVIDKKDNVIEGKHCFVFSSGERIDCCVEEEFSFKVEKKNEKTYEGVLFSCYDDLEYKISLSFDKNYINFRFIGSPHPFVPNELKLYKE